jgi:methionine synthase / methylenetetrahydrofolate reductase(NADPH)
VMERFLSAYTAEFGPLPLPVLAGILPLFGTRHAAFLHNEVPGIDIPEGLRRRIDRAGDDSPREGVLIARELVADLKEMAQGIYLMPAFNRYDLAASVIDVLGRSRLPETSPPRYLAQE